MVAFGDGHWTPMDREYTMVAPKKTGDVAVGDIGFSMGLGVGSGRNIPAIAATMRTGQKHLELTFMGFGKGGGQGHAPGTYGKRQRQAFKELQKANQYDFTVHSSVGISGLSGHDGRSGNFNKDAQQRNVNEIKRAVDFAAEVAQGGPVVVHSGEFTRHVVDAPWNKQGKYKDKFELYPGEEERANIYLVDIRTGDSINIKKNQAVSVPVWKRYTPGDAEWQRHGGKEYTDENGQQIKEGTYIDYLGRKVDPSKRVPLYDTKKGEFVAQQLTWQQVEKEAVDMTDRARKFWRDWKQGVISEKEFQESYWGRYAGKEFVTEKDVIVKPEEAYIISQLETEAASRRGLALHYGADYENTLVALRKLKKEEQLYKRISAEVDPEQKHKLLEGADVDDLPAGPREVQKKLGEIRSSIYRVEQDIRHKQESAASQWASAEQTVERIRNIESAERYAKRESHKAYAESAIRAMRQSDQLAKKGQLKQPLALAVENLFPESYGGHPDELIDLIENSRREMKDILVKKYGYEEAKAKKESEEHLYATFDTAHFNMWWKYWKNDDHKTTAQNRADFEVWYLKQVEKLAEKKIVGHLHLVDNNGYEDEHLAPGEGNAPVDKALEIFKKNGFKGRIVVEPGADFYTDTSGHQTLLKAWRHFGAPISGASSDGTRRNWGHIQYGHMGGSQPPYFTFGGYSPSEDWTLWSGVPLE